MTLFSDGRSMAVGTLLRRRRVEKNRPPSNFLAQFVAAGARHVPVRAAELEPGLIVIEAGRMPDASLVAGCAIAGLTRESAELAEVDVLMALGTFAGRVPIHDALQPSGGGCGTMALVTVHALVSSGQGEAGRGMVEALDIPPRAHCVTGLASCLPR